MNAFSRVRAATAGLIALSFAALLTALFLSDSLSLKDARALSSSLGRTESADRESALVRSVAQQLSPEAVLADGRRGQILESLSRAADDPALVAWASESPSGRRKADPGSLLAALCRGKGWISAVLTDKAGRVAAAWPVSASGGDLSKDPYFKTLSDSSMGPGIVRHGYAQNFSARNGAGIPVHLVAACGIADRTGDFAGLLKVRVDARRVLLGTGVSPLEALRASYPASNLAFVLGDGTEVYKSDRAAWTENFGGIAGFSGVLSAALRSPSGGLDVDGTEVVWQRVGSTAQGAAPGDVLSIFALVPQATAPGSSGPEPEPFFENRSVLLPLAVAFLGLIAAFILLFKNAPSSSKAHAGGAASAPRPTASPESPAVAEPAPDERGPRPSAGREEQDALKEELALSQAALKEAQQDHELEMHNFDRVRVQVDELRSSLEASKRETAKAESEVKALKARVQESARALETRPDPVSKGDEAPPASKEQEAARFAAISTLSEELKATLEVIKGYINSLLGGQGAIGDAQQEFLGVVINKSARLERLISDLMDFSEAGADLKPPRLETLAFSALIQDVLVNVRPQAENKNVSLDFVEPGGAAQAQVRVDREKMGTLVRALLSQAVKVSPRNEKIGLVLNERDGLVEFRITDAGLALPPERAATVFVQFHGVDSQAGPEFIGTGLRFAIAKRTAATYGGSIAIESASTGRGKTFVLALPKAAEAAAGTAPALPGVSASGGLPALQSLPNLPRLGPPPAVPMMPPAFGVPASASVLPASLPPPPPMVRPAPEAAAPKATVPLVHKPAPVDETFNSPWKRKETSLGDDLDEMMNLAAEPAVGAGQGKIPAGTDSSDFERVFGAAPGVLPKAVPKVGPAPSAAPAEVLPSLAPPQVPKPPISSAVGVDFDALFGPPTGPAAGAPPPAPVQETPGPAASEGSKGGLDTMDDLNKLLGQ